MNQSPSTWKRTARMFATLLVVGFAVAWLVHNLSWEDRWRAPDGVVGTLTGDPPRLHLPDGAERELTPTAREALVRERGLRSAVREVPPLSIALSLVLVVLATAVAAARWALVLRGLGEPVTWRESMRVVLEAQGLSMVLPGAVGGDLYRVAWLMGRKMPGVRATLSVAVDRLLGLWVFVLMVALAASQADTWTRWPGLWVAPWLLTGGLVLGALASVLVPLTWLPTVLRDSVVFLRRAVREQPVALVAIVVLSALNTGLHGLNALLMLRAMSAHFPPLADAAVGAGLGMLANALPIAPAGIGVGEAAYMYVFGQLGVAAADVLVSLLLLRAVSFALAVVAAVAHVWRRTRTQERSES